MLISQEGHIKLTDFGLSCHGSVLRQQEGTEEQQQPPLLPNSFLGDFISDSGTSTPTALPASVMHHKCAQQQQRQGQIDAWEEMQQQQQEQQLLAAGGVGSRSEDGEAASCCSSVPMETDQPAEGTMPPAAAADACSISAAGIPHSKMQALCSKTCAIEFEEHPNEESSWVRKGAKGVPAGCEGSDGAGMSSFSNMDSIPVGSFSFGKSQLGMRGSRRGSTGSMAGTAVFQRCGCAPCDAGMKVPAVAADCIDQLPIGGGPSCLASKVQGGEKPAAAAAAATAAARAVVEAAAAAVTRSSSGGSSSSLKQDGTTRSNRKQQLDRLPPVATPLSMQQSKKARCGTLVAGCGLDEVAFKQATRLGLEEALRGTALRGGGCTPVGVWTPKGRQSFTGECCSFPQTLFEQCVCECSMTGTSAYAQQRCCCTVSFQCQHIEPYCTNYGSVTCKQRVWHNWQLQQAVPGDSWGQLTGFQDELAVIAILCIVFDCLAC